MRLTLLVHILAGASALVLAIVALWATKGSRPQRKSGRLFVYAMLVMSVAGVMIAPLRGTAPAVNIPAGLLAVYLVVTALTTLAPRTRTTRRLDVIAMLLAFGIGLVSIAVATGALVYGKPGRSAAVVLLILGVVAWLAAGSDVRMLRSAGPAGAARLARHLWRMCFALCISATAFFLGQPHVFPRALRNSGLLVVPVLAALFTMLYWLWRVRVKGGYRAVIGVRE